MPEYQKKCDIASIPERLHSYGKDAPKAIQDGDHVVFWFAPKEAQEIVSDQEGTGEFHLKCFRVTNQSVESVLLNTGGSVNDVKIDGTTGEELSGVSLACLRVGALRDNGFAAAVKNATASKSGRMPRFDPLIYQYDVIHDAIPCKYAHCELVVYCNGEVPKKIPEAAQTALRGFVGRCVAKGQKKLADLLKSQDEAPVPQDQVGLLKSDQESDDAAIITPIPTDGQKSESPK